MEYSPDLKHNHATSFLAQEYERLEMEKMSAQTAAGSDRELATLAAEDRKSVV